MDLKVWCRAALRRATANPMLRRGLAALTHAGALPPSIWKRLPVELTFRVKLSDGKDFLYSSIADDSNGRYLYWRGMSAFSNEGLQLFWRLAKQARYIVDIGASTGVFTFIACAGNSESHVISFEPVPVNFQRLMSTVALNGWERKCDARCAAVSNFVGSAPFHVPAGATPISASLNPQGFRGCKGELIQTQVTTLDTIVPLGQQVDLVKIDVEGFEDKVLEGMRRVVSDSKPNLIIECNPDGPLTEVERITSEYGYRSYHIKNERLIPIRHIAEHASNLYPNFFFTMADAPTS